MKKTSVNSQEPQRYSLLRKDDGTIEIKVIIPWSEVEKIRGEVTEELIKQVEAPGFRKGNVPRNIAQEKINKEQVKEEVLKKILSQEYVAAVKHFNLNPIVNPRIHVEQFTEGTDLEFTADTCEEPKVELKNYKDEVQKIKPVPKIIVPGKPETEGEPTKKLDEILAVILNVVEIQVPQILIDQETNRLLSQLLDEIKRLGVSLDQYLASRGKTDEQLRIEYGERAEKDLKLEFLLRKIADEEKITVEQKEIDEALTSLKDDKQKQETAQNPYILAAIIRQQKTLDFLSKI